MHQFPDNARVWIFQADREFTPDEIKWAFPKLKGFITEWQAHGRALAAHTEIRYNRFIVVMVDESDSVASGCSIDSLHRFIKELEKALDVQLLDRLTMTWKENDKVVAGSFETFRELLQTGGITPSTIVFNNLAATKKELEENWEIPLNQSWHQRILND